MIYIIVTGTTAISEMQKIFKLAIILLLPVYVKAQKKIRFNNFDKSYLTMTHCPFDSSAAAFYINEYGRSAFNHNLEIEFTYHVVLKILSPQEYHRADINVLHSKDDRVAGFEAVTYNLVDGKVEKSELKRKDAIVEEVDEETRSFNFTFPNVKEGSIIEYTYTVGRGSVAALRGWYFQTSIPAIKSQYEAIIPTFFNYERMYQGYFPLKKADVKYKVLPIAAGLTANHQIHNYVAENVPAFKDEPLMTTRDDYISKILFELKRYDLPNQPPKVFIPDSFIELAKQYYENEYWQGSVTDSKFTRDVVEVLKIANPQPLQLAESIYYFVRNNFQEDYEIGLTTQKKVFQEKKGTAGQINRVMAAMMNEAGLKTNIVRISTRDHGRVLKHIPIDHQFNHTLVHINIDGIRILLDANEANIPFNVLPKYCINGEGLLISETPEWIFLKPNQNNSITYGGQFKLSGGILIGEFTRKLLGYHAWDFLNGNKNIDKYKQGFNQNMQTWIIDNHDVSELQNDDTITETIQVEIEGKIDDIGDLIYLNPIIYNQLEGNPFKSPTRSFPVNYGFPISETHYYQIELGEAYEVEELPKPLSIGLPDNGGNLIFNVTQNGDMITVMCRTQIKKVEFPAEQYAYLRELFAQKIEKQGEQIVLRRK